MDGKKGGAGGRLHPPRRPPAPRPDDGRDRSTTNQASSRSAQRNNMPGRATPAAGAQPCLESSAASRAQAQQGAWERRPELGVEDRFARASEAMRAAARQHADTPLADSSSDEDTDPSAGKDIIDKIINAYKVSSKDTSQINKTIYFLEETLKSGSASCLICIGKIKNKDAIWNCMQCHTMLHLICVQKWAKDSIEAITFRMEWDCPKCRKAYSKEEIPQRYECFCGGEADPPPHAWLLPHSCGSNCNKALNPPCGHRCVLLCHPGPCPPCPRFVPAACHCGRGGTRSVRCDRREWECGGTCARALNCGTHACERPCHAGECGPCERRVERWCACGARSEAVACGTPAWSCDKVCGALLVCGSHCCARVCHAAGDCEPCPYEGATSCPCGAERAQLACPEPPPLCGGTCGKPLPCGMHACPEKCHRGDCPPCALVVTKRCRCGANEKSLPCSRTFACESKCRERPCGRHACSRRCCVSCPPCERPCGKVLSCGKHKCPSTCHRGPCYPCPLQNRVSCRCGGSFYMINCGRKNSKIPACSLPCREKYNCGHTEENAHKCHLGECPPCKAKCERPLPDCTHRCQAQCHSSVKVVFSTTAAPATPVEVQSPKVKTMRLSCPPCGAPVPVPCLGGHEVAPQACRSARRASCGRPCGAPLSCTRHACSLPCHLVAPDPDLPGAETSCEPCERECPAPRPPHCAHRCPSGECHPPPCAPCRRPVRVRCHCGAHAWGSSCDRLEHAAEHEMSCKLRCSRTKECGHRCSQICHPGPCDAARDCTKLVKASCACKTLKEEIECRKWKGGELVVSCSAVCEEKKTALVRQQEEEKRRLQLLQDEKNRKELEEFERMFKKGGKKKGKFEKSVVKDRRDNKKWWALAIVLVLVALLAGFLLVEY